MGRERDVKLTRFELEIMDALWQLGRGSVREVQERIPEKKRPAYTTVQTMVYRLEEKGAVRRIKKIGNAQIFEPVITRKLAHQRWIMDLLEVFGGSARPLMAHLVEIGKLNLAEIRQLEKLLREQAVANLPATSPMEKGGARGGRRRSPKK